MIDLTIHINPVNGQNQINNEKIHSKEFMNGCYFHYKNDSYPIQIKDTTLHTIIIEGCIYNINKTQLETELNFLTNEPSELALVNKIRAFQNKADGEFNIYLLTKHNNNIKDLFFFSDKLNRLPLYFYEKKGEIIVSRNINNITCRIPKSEINPNFILDHLVFGFSINNSTIDNRIQTSNEGQIVIYKETNKYSSSKHQINFDLTFQKKYKNKNEYIEDIYTTLNKSIRDRLKHIGDSPYSCDITGGFDSRTVFGFLLNEQNVTYTTNTILGDEAIIAEQLVRKFNQKKHIVIPSEHEQLNQKYKSILTHLQPFSGNFASNFTSLIALKKQKEIINHQYRIGGIGFTDFIRKGFRNDKQTISTYFRKFNPYGLTINEACKMLSYSVGEYIQYIDQTISGWPEKSNQDKFKRLFYLRTLILQSRLSEDRERLFYWNIHPLWNADLCINTLIHFPLDWRGYHVHYLLIEKINPQLNTIPYLKSYINIADEKKLMQMDQKDNSFIYQKLKSIVKKPKTFSQHSNINMKQLRLEELVSSEFNLNHQNESIKYIKESIINSKNQFAYNALN